MHVDNFGEAGFSTGPHPEFKPLVTQRQLKLITLATQQERTDPQEWDPCFGSRLLAQLSLPYKDPGAVPEWVRKNNALTLTLTPGAITTDGVRERKYPFGVIPRYLLTWITTEVVLTRSRQIELGSSLAAFLRTIGMNTSGASGRRAMDQLQRLAVANLNIEDTRQYTHGQRVRGENFNVASSYDLWFGEQDPQQPALLPSTITLSERFYEETMRAPVKLDPRVLKVLAGSPMRVDMYTWMAFRTRDLRKASVVSWKQLAEQFGAEYKQPRQFKEAFKRNLREVAYFFPLGSFTVLDNGIKLNAKRSSALRSKTEGTQSA